MHYLLEKLKLSGPPATFLHLLPLSLHPSLLKKVKLSGPHARFLHLVPLSLQSTSFVPQESQAEWIARNVSPSCASQFTSFAPQESKAELTARTVFYLFGRAGPVHVSTHSSTAGWDHPFDSRSSRHHMFAQTQFHLAPVSKTWW